MTTPYKLVVFDWEGTLGDPLGHIHHALYQEAKRLALEAYDPKVGRRYVALGLEKAVQKIFPGLNMHVYEQLLMGMQQVLTNHAASVFLFPGAVQAIHTLHKAGVMLAIATNKGEGSLERDLQATDLSAYFAVTASASRFPVKPSPEMLQAVLDETGIEAQEAIMIGDSVSDMDMASALGVASVGVDFYHQQAEDLQAHGAKAVFDDFQQLLRFLGFKEGE